MAACSRNDDQGRQSNVSLSANLARATVHGMVNSEVLRLTYTKKILLVVIDPGFVVVSELDTYDKLTINAILDLDI